MALSTEQQIQEFFKQQAATGKTIDITYCSTCRKHLKEKGGWHYFDQSTILDILNDPRLKNGTTTKEICPTCKQIKKEAAAGKAINITYCLTCQKYLKDQDGWRELNKDAIQDILNDPRLKNGTTTMETCPTCKQKQEEVAVAV